eukprot:RCo054975
MSLQCSVCLERLAGPSADTAEKLRSCVELLPLLDGLAEAEQLNLFSSMEGSSGKRCLEALHGVPSSCAPLSWAHIATLSRILELEAQAAGTSAAVLSLVTKSGVSAGLLALLRALLGQGPPSSASTDGDYPAGALRRRASSIPNAEAPGHSLLRSVVVYSADATFTAEFLRLKGSKVLSELLASPTLVSSSLRDHVITTLAALVTSTPFQLYLTDHTTQALLEAIDTGSLPMKAASSTVLSFCLDMAAGTRAVAAHNSALLLQHLAVPVLVQQLPKAWDPSMPPVPVEKDALVAMLRLLAVLLSHPQHRTPMERCGGAGVVVYLQRRSFSVELLLLTARCLHRVTTGATVAGVVAEVLEAVDIREAIQIYAMEAMLVLSSEGGSTGLFSRGAVERVLQLGLSPSPPTAATALQLLLTTAKIRGSPEALPEESRQAVAAFAAGQVNRIVNQSVPPSWDWPVQRQILLLAVQVMDAASATDLDAQLTLQVLQRRNALEFLREKPIGLRSVCIRAISRVFTKGCRHDPAFRERAVVTLQRSYRRLVPHNIYVRQSHRMELLRECLVQKLTMEEQWLQGVYRLQKEYFLRIWV